MPMHPLAVDRFASALLDDITPGDWLSMRDALSDLVAALRAGAERGDRVVHPGPDAREVVGDLISKMGVPEVGSALQARLWTLSDRPSHRARGESWLAEHPAEAADPAGELDDDNLLLVRDGPLTDHPPAG